MRRAVTVFVLGVLAVIGVLAGVYAPGGGASVGKASATIKINVKASEFKFVLSRRSVPAGSTVIFTVTNAGKISHDFKIAGKKTPTLNPGTKATLKIVFKKKGKYPYLCTLLGHASAGMKGTFGVGVAPPPPPPTTSTTPTTTTTAPPPPTGPIGTAQTTVTVNMFEYRFDLSQTSIPSGQVTFVITNKGNEVHNFAIAGSKSGALLAPGASESWTVGLPAGTYNYVCDVPFHADRGMVGQFTITP
ncbi:MAG TPA: cupredoxin domain-containing protein [Gaiellaceae bacterium]|nr:cupredoxin domain-containing protein [Gaiellaceae bacterium]